MWWKTDKIKNNEPSIATEWSYTDPEKQMVADIPKWVYDHVIFSQLGFVLRSIWFVNYGKLELMRLGDVLKIDENGHVTRN